MIYIIAPLGISFVVIAAVLIGLYSVAQPGLKLTAILLLQLPKWQDYQCEATGSEFAVVVLNKVSLCHLKLALNIRASCFKALLCLAYVELTDFGRCRKQSSGLKNSTPGVLGW